MKAKHLLEILLDPESGIDPEDEILVSVDSDLGYPLTGVWVTSCDDGMYLLLESEPPDLN
jgi:hypothetical protein